jgi:hypothetical protein
MEVSKLNDSNALDTLDMEVLLSELKNPVIGLKIGNRKVLLVVLLLTHC